MRSAEEFEEAQRRTATDMSDSAIARQTGIPRRTVWDWRYCKPIIRPRFLSGSSPRSVAHDSAAPSRVLLCARSLARRWLYLTKRPRLAAKDLSRRQVPGNIDRRRETFDILMPGQRAATRRRSCRCTAVSRYSKHWPCLLPQHGPGRDHLRPIRLQARQEVLVTQATEEFVRGLPASDGCRMVANDRGVRSVRDHVSNRSEDILGLFSAALDALSIPWTRPSKHVIAVYRKAAVARLDQFVGPRVASREVV